MLKKYLKPKVESRRELERKEQFVPAVALAAGLVVGGAAAQLAMSDRSYKKLNKLQPIF